MAELPEIIIFAQQMNKQLSSKIFDSVNIKQEKILNMDKPQFSNLIVRKEVLNVYHKGKWIFMDLSDDYFLLLNLGMGADILYHEKNQELPEDYHIHFNFTDNSGFTCKFWWIGRAELIASNELSDHKPTKDIAISPLDHDFDLKHFENLIKGRSQIKNILLNQKKIGGIGNVYVHDILFKAQIHPKKLVNQLEHFQIENLYHSMVNQLKDALEKGGLFYEKDFFGKEWGFTRDYFLVAYNEGKPCPVCGTTIEKIKTGSTSSYICPECQKL
ncbi:DNA-formamidopyrimidine glycosylase family protein [Methanobacterium alcaliphilum]|uniref:DNA-formamidopyrimidine glycosylase family protein n=1 Tax=Methanobacterium alcaliphilum TaxID=392018 RepID=UPI00200A81B1|nr:DNA-formamidopyrimidine glycosylase family protein [Methanobacterium alcaliphilum]MCK9151916.1 formamidopyrimidine-DNA glycosylase [Methanobacterium alcaliphilum]